MYKFEKFFKVELLIKIRKDEEGSTAAPDTMIAALKKMRGTAGIIDRIKSA